MKQKIDLYPDNLYLRNAIVNLAFMPVDELSKELELLDYKLEHSVYGRSFVVDNGSVKVGFCNCDPVSASVQLSVLIYGQRWYMFLPDLLKEVNKKWKKEVQQRKRNNQ